MGENFKQDHAAAFKQQQCQAYRRELKQDTLFSRTTHALERTYACTAYAPVDERLIGAQVLLWLRGNAVVVVHGNRELGRLVEDDASLMAAIIRAEPHCPGMALGEIDDVSAATGEFHVRLVDHSEDE